MAQFEIWYGDDRGNRLALLNYNSGFEYVKVLNEVGYFSLSLPLSIFDTSMIRKDARIEIWRAYPQGALTLDFLGFLRQYHYRTDERGHTTLELSGPDLNYLISGRNVLYYAGASQSIATAEYADNLCKRLMRENAGSSATDADRSLASLGLTISANLSAAQQITLSFAYKNVLDVCQDAAEASRQKGTPLYFGVTPTSPTTFDFQTKINQWGFDRTAIGFQGTLGLEFGNLASPELSTDWNDEYTHVTAGGKGDGAARQTRTAQDDERIGESAWGLREGFVDARSETTSNGVTDAAKAALERYRPRRRFTGTIVNTSGFMYGRDWGHGDKLAWTYQGQQGNGIVRSVKVTVDGKGREVVDARLETE